MREMFGLTIQQHLMAGSAAIAMLVGVDPALAQIRTFDVPVGPAYRTIPTFAKQAGIQILASGGSVRSKRTNQVKGAYSADEAIHILLNGTGLSAAAPDPTGIVTVRAEGSDPMGEADAGSAAASIESAEIIVTAQRREESLQNVPISITALSGDRLDKSSESVNDQLARVPGVAVLEGTFGSSLMTIRGVASTDAFLAGASTAGYYLDTVPFGFVRRAFTPNANAFDLQRIEVLRGPQGTLYGVSSQSGVVRVLTHPADLDKFSLKGRAYVSTTKSGGTNFRGDVAVNIPVIQDRLGVRAVVGRENLSGWIDRPNAGERNINDAKLTNARIRIDAVPSDRLTLSAMYWHNEESYGDTNNGLDDRTTDIGRRSPSKANYDIYSFTAAYDFGPFVFKSATSHIDYVLDGFGPIGGNIAITQHFPSKVFAEELSLTSTGDGPWRWSIGAIYRDAKDILAQNIVCGSTICILPNPAGLIDQDQSRSHAIFGEVTRNVTDTLDLTLGLRYFEDKVKYTQLSNGFDANATLIRRTDSFDSMTPRVVLTWHPTNDFTTYASYAQGFRSGFGQNGTALSVDPTLPPAGPDTLTSYEVGAKGSLWNDSVSYEVAAYYQKWSDVQQFIVIPFLTTGISAVINGTSARGSGVDLGLNWRPVRNLRLAASFSWNDLTFDSDVFSGNPPAVIAHRGDRLGNSPKLTVGFSGDYQFALANGYTANMSADVNRTSSRVARGRDVSNNLVEVKGDKVTTVNARFAVDSPSGWTISIFGENLSDFNGTPAPALFIPQGGTNRLRPLTIGLQFEFQL